MFEHNLKFECLSDGFEVGRKSFTRQGISKFILFRRTRFIISDSVAFVLCKDNCKALCDCVCTQIGEIWDLQPFLRGITRHCNESSLMTMLMVMVMVQDGGQGYHDYGYHRLPHSQ